MKTAIQFGAGIVRMSHNGEQICILQLKSITASTLSGFVPARSEDGDYCDCDK